MNDLASYLAEIELALVSSPVVAAYQIVRSWVNTDDGYIRIRATLTNGDFLEAAEYFCLRDEQVVTLDYRHHWADPTKQVLRRRWDSTPDHPELENFPHHAHLGNAETVVPGQPQSLIDLLKIIEGELT